MFDVGFAELFLLALIGLIVLGPERLPAVARTLGGLVRKARLSWISLRSTIESELAEADIAAPIKEAGEELRRFGKDMSAAMPDYSDVPGFIPQNHESTAEQESTGSDSDRRESQSGESQSGEGPAGDTESGKDSDA